MYYLKPVALLFIIKSKTHDYNTKYNNTKSLALELTIRLTHKKLFEVL